MVVQTLQVEDALEHGLLDTAVRADVERGVQFFLEGGGVPGPVGHIGVEVHDLLGGEVRREDGTLDDAVDVGVDVCRRLVIEMLHHLGFCAGQQGLVRREGGTDGVRVTDARHGVRIFEHIRNLPRADLVVGGTVVPGRAEVIVLSGLVPAGRTPDLPGVLCLRERQIGVVRVLGDAGIAEVVAEGRIAGQHQQVGILGRVDKRIADDIPVPFQLAQRFPVAQHAGRLGTDALGGVFHRLVPLLIEEIEAGGEGVGRAGVEVIFRNAVIGVAHILEGKFQVALDLGVHLGYIAAVILGIELLLHHLHVGDAEVGAAGLLVIMETELVHQHKVVVGADQQRLGHLGAEAAGCNFRVLGDGGGPGELVNGVQTLIGMSDAQPGFAPEAVRSVVVDTQFRYILPGVELVEETFGAGVVVADIVHIVGHIFIKCQVVRRRITGGEQGADFGFGIHFRPVVGHGVQELVAGNETRKRCKRSNDVSCFHSVAPT